MKPRWSEADIGFLEQCLEQDQRTYTSAQLAAKLEQERNVRLSPDRIRRILQKRGSDGSGRATPNDNDKSQNSDALSKRTLRR
jgi:transposase